MFETFIIIEDVGVEPDFAGNWPKRGVAKITHDFDFGLPCLGTLTVHLAKDHSPAEFSISVDFWDDGGLHPTDSGSAGRLNLDELCAEGYPLQLACNEISKAEFETHLEFETLREVKFIPKES